MKKRNLILAGALAIALTGCSLPGSLPKEVEEAVQDEAKTDDGNSSATTEAQAQDGAQATAEPAVQESPLIFKEVTKYYHEVYDGTYTEDKDGHPLENKPLFEGKSEAIMLSDQCEDAYPALYKALKETASDFLQGAENDAKTTAQNAKTDLEDAIENDYFFAGPYTSSNTASISRADDKVVCICDYGSSFEGGAHGMYGMSGTTYDVATGQVITLDQVLNLSEEELNTVLMTKLQDNAEDTDQFWDLEDTLSHYKFNPDTASSDSDNFEYGYTWYLAQDGVHFYFGPYEIGPYSNGDKDVLIGYNELSGAINEEYFPDSSKGYISAANLPTYSKEWDDDTSPLHFVYEKEEEDTVEEGYFYCKSLTLKDMDKSATADVYFDFNSNYNVLNPYRVVTADGREYIYVSILSFNDYTELLVFDITDDDIKLVGQDSFHYVYVDSSTDLAGEIVLTDPDNMYFGKVSDILGTFTCYTRYQVGADGMPKMADNIYTISWISDEIKLAKELTVPIIDNDGNEQSKETLPVGTGIKPIRTDNSQFVDCQLDDGRLIRLNYTKTDHPAQIEGQNVDDIFEGLTYAG